MRFAAWISCSALSLLGACAAPANGDGDSSKGGSTDASETGSDSADTGETGDTGDTGETGETGDTTGEAPTSTLGGWVVDEAGNPLAELPITLCGEVCQIATTDAEGFFFVDQVSAGIKVLEPALVPYTDDLGAAVLSWTRFFDFVTVGEGEAVIVDEPLVMRRIEQSFGPLVGPQSLELVPGLVVEFDADVVIGDGPLPVGVDEIWLGALALPEEAWPIGGLGDWSIVAAWSFAPWDLEAEDAFAATITLDTPLAPGTEVGLLVADYTYGFTTGGFFEEAAELSLDGTTISTPAGAGIDRTTMWLVVTR